MLLNRILEGARAWTLGQRLLARRARAVGDRAPVVLVPPVLGTRLVDGRGRTVWGSASRVFVGHRRAESAEVRSAGVLDGLGLVPGLYAYDVMGGMLRFLERVGGYRDGEDLFVLDYDWRLGVAHGAARLAALVERIRGAGEQRVDLIGVSSGGAIARCYLAYGDEDPTRAGDVAPRFAGSSRVRRVVYVGAPHRGSQSTLERLHQGVVMAPLGRRFTELTSFQTSYDLLPHPDDPLFIDGRGDAMHPALDLYDPDVWSRLHLATRSPLDLGDKLERARRLHRALDRAGGHPDTIVIAARHLPTAARVIVERGGVRFPGCEPAPDDPLVGAIYVPGDGAIPESSARALPGLDEQRIWAATPREHHRFPADPTVQRLVLEALLGSDPRAPRPTRRRLETAARACD